MDLLTRTRVPTATPRAAMANRAAVLDPAVPDHAVPDRAPGDSPFLSEERLRRDRVPTHAWVLLGILAVAGVISLVLTSLRVGGLWTLLLYSIPSNTAIAVLPHEPMLLLYGGRADVWLAAVAATAGTVIAGLLDHRIFVPMLNVEGMSGYKRNRMYQRVMRLFGRAPFAAIAIAGCTPVPFFPFKLLAFSGGYSLPRYLGALALGRFPRYALILWVGSAIYIPAWLLVAAALLALSAYAVHFLVPRRGRARSRSPVTAAVPPSPPAS